MQILAPRWIRPHLLTAGQTFELVIDTDAASVEGIVRASLVRDGANQPLEVSIQAGAGHGGRTNRIVADCRVPSDAAMGVWDVRASIGERTDVVPQCVRVIERFPEAFTFVHMTDVHIWCKTTDREVEDRSPLVERVVEQINAIEPEFVLNTGDLYSRYGTRPPDVFSPEEVERQASTVRELLLKLNAPMFATPGNHDVAFLWSRKSWARHMGYPHTGGPDDYISTSATATSPRSTAAARMTRRR